MLHDHAPIAPSSLEMTVACPASVSLQTKIPPQPPTEEEAEGVAAHVIAMQYADGFGRDYPVGKKFEVKGRTWEVDADMAHGAKMYLNAVGGYHSDLRLEDPVGVKRIHVDKCYGTPDAWRYMPTYDVPPGTPDLPPGRIKLVRVVDYKYGHRYVEVFENYQLAAYAQGVLERLELNDNIEDLYLELTIVQPRAYHKEGPVRWWRGHASMLRAVLNIAHGAAREALGDSPRARTGPQCLDCRARQACKTLQTATQTFIDFSTSPELVELPPEAIGQEMVLLEEAIDRLEARYNGLAAQAEIMLRAGKPVAFYHMEPGQSRRVYRDDVTLDELVGLGDLCNIDLRKQQTLKDQLVTPTQAIQLGIDEAVINQYSHRPPAALKLARDNSITARKVFSK